MMPGVRHALLRTRNQRRSLLTVAVVLPRLAVFAASNNHVTMEAHKREVALQLFEAYSALSCCCILDVTGCQFCSLQLHVHVSEATLFVKIHSFVCVKCFVMRNYVYTRNYYI